MMVSGNERPATTDRRKPITDRRPKEVGIAMITEPMEGSLVCSCNGFATVHPRKTVRERQADRHIERKHNGQAVWL
jgi:hypothetical protein